MNFISDEPNLPPIPAIGENVLGKRLRKIPREFTVIKCSECKEDETRPFTPGDYTFKKLSDETCKKCNKKNTLTIEEIYSEWYDPKKDKKK